MKIGIQELLVVFIVALIVLGPDKLPLYARKFGEALREFRKFSSDATKDIRESIVEPLEEAQRPLREALEPITELDKEVRGELEGIQKSFSDIGKPVKKEALPAGGSPEEQGGPEPGRGDGFQTGLDGSVGTAVPEAGPSGKGSGDFPEAEGNAGNPEMAKAGAAVLQPDGPGALNTADVDGGFGDGEAADTREAGTGGVSGRDFLEQQAVSYD